MENNGVTKQQGRSESEDALRESQRALLISRNVDKTRDPISAEDDVDQSPRTAICTPKFRVFHIQFEISFLASLVLCAHEEFCEFKLK